MTEGSFECRVSSKRESKAGIYLTLEISPDDYTADLATLRVGSLLIVGWSEIVNTAVEPIAAIAQSVERQPSKLDVESSNLSGRSKPPRPFSSLPLSQQAALRCSDETFREFVRVHVGLEQLPSEEVAADFVRTKCHVTSRSQLDVLTYIVPRGEWRACEAKYQSWLTDRQYKDSRR